MERQTEIDILKALAIIGVILIHVTSNSFAPYPQKSVAWYGFILLDQIMRFSVPLFVALSGYTLAISDQRRHLNPKDFYLRRAFRIIPYYLAATAIIYLYLHFIPPWSQVQNPYPLWQIIFLGRADYHLYFIPMIFQLYLAFPFIIKIFNKWPKTILAGAAIVQTMVFATTTPLAQKLITLPFPWGDQQQYLFSLSWIFYFVLGISLAKNTAFQTKNDKLLKFAALTLIVTGFSLTIFESFRTLNLSENLIEATRFTRLPIILYATGAILASVLFAKNLLKLPTSIVEILGKIGLMSFSIYLIHTIAIRMVILNIDVYPIQSFFLFATISILLSFAFARIFENGVKFFLKLFP